MLNTILDGLDGQNQGGGSDTSSTISSDHSSDEATADVTSNGVAETMQEVVEPKNEMRLLDLYSGCGAMSTGLCLGASLSGIKLVNVSLLSGFHSRCFK